MKSILLSALVTLTIATAVAQPWVSPNAKSYTKLSQHKADFYSYWKGKPMPTKKGSGYKQFKRWENFWETRLMPDGTFPTAQTLWNNYQLTNKKQTNSKQLAPANWVDIGPVNCTVTSSYSPGHGRTTVVVQNPQNPNSLYVGTPAGGIFKSVNAGATWACLSNQIASLGISGIAVNATDTNQIFISTGDIDGGDTYSVGVLQSNDNGATWNITGNIATYATGKLMYEPNSISTLWLAGADGMFKSTDNGVNWYNVLSSTAGVQDFSFKPNDPNTVYVVNNTGLYTSINGGANFNIATILGSLSSYNRIAVTAANPNYVYLVTAGNSTADILRSTDAGVTFNTQQSLIPVSSQGWYDMAVGASPTNADEVYFGILNLYQSLDGGVTGAEINSWSNSLQPTYTHADIHSISYYGNNMYVCSDGGLYKSNNGANSFNDLSTQLPTAQIYRISGSVYDKGVLGAGLQDNGGFCYTNGGWKIYNGGDGMDNAVNSSNPDVLYGMYQYGSIYRTADGGLTVDGMFNSWAGNPNQGNWVTPLQIDPKNSNRVLAGYEQVYEYLATTNAWKVLTNSNLTGNNISELRMYPANGNVMYVTTGYNLYSTTNGGTTWSNQTTNLPALASNITSIDIHPTDSLQLWITVGGYNGGNNIYYSNSGGNTWANISGTLPNMPVNIIKYANDGTDGLYIGTDYGVYYNNNVLNNWVAFNTNLPNVIIRDLEINPTHDLLRAGTYGRGVWETNLYNPIVAKPTFPKPTAYFTSNNNNICVGDSIKFNDKSSFATSWNWSFTGGVPATSTLKNQTVTYAIAGTYAVKLVVTGVNGTDSLVQNSYISVGNNVLNFPFAENFEATATNGGLHSVFKTTTNNGSALQWNLFENSNFNISGYGIDTVSVYLNNYNSAAGNISTLETPVYKMNNSNYVLKFDYAYNYYDLNNTDTLLVEYSIDCGVTYNQLWYKGGADLVTAIVPGYTSTFYPAANEWSTASINLTTIPVNADVSFRFKDISDYGNLLYIDNININNTVGAKATMVNNKKTTLYPNPTTGEFSISATLVPNQTYAVTIYNTLGQIVCTKTVNGSTNFNTHINLSNQAKGMYSVTLTGNNTSQTQKLIIE
ncbi:MAG: T9SS type A sorting domain-containing protein [Bacteroidia bacterium]|nr:T9SS type A sorting domain-containing protein [Bacteroidia bacterium]